MPFYLGTKEQCEMYDAMVISGESYPGFTSSWGVPRKHPTKDIYSIRTHWKYEFQDMARIDALTPDWNSRAIL